MSGFLVEKAGRKYLKKKKNVKCRANYACTLIKYSLHLHRAGRNAQSLACAQKGFKLFKQLYGENRKRFAPEYAKSLSNVSSRLNDAGKYEEGLTNAEKALEIFQRLARNNPDRYEPEYAMSLNNVASHLSDAGKYEEGLSHAQQASEIYHRLAVKYPERFEVDSFSCTCETFFLGWLINSTNKEGGPAELPAIPATAPPHQYPRLQLYRNFVQACCFSDKATRADEFKQAIDIWGKLSPADQNHNQSYWMCSTAWCATFIPETIEEIDWQASWRQFKAQKHGCIPVWMHETAQRLPFQWPQ